MHRSLLSALGVAWMLQSGGMSFYLDRLAHLILNVENELTEYVHRLWGTSEATHEEIGKGVR